MRIEEEKQKKHRTENFKISIELKKIYKIQRHTENTNTTKKTIFSYNKKLIESFSIFNSNFFPISILLLAPPIVPS
jgi:hypothetical protein